MVDPTQHETLREALLDQLAYLIDEVEALKALIGRVPPPVQEARPLPGERSLKELYGLLASFDEAVYLPRLQAVVAEEEPAFQAADEDALVAQASWNEQPIERILEQVQEARRRLVAFLRALPSAAWIRAGRFGTERRNVYQLAHHVTQHDADLLRTVGYRLHETRLSDRPRDIPK